MSKYISLLVALTVLHTGVLLAQDSSPAANPEQSASPTKAKHSKKKKEATTAAAPASTTNAESTAPGGTKKMPAASGAIAPGGGPGMVWVNSETHVYHRQGSRWYGRTKKGKYMTEADAIKEGDRADKEEKPKPKS